VKPFHNFLKQEKEYIVNDTMEMERRSSAVSLSDMEVFIFPELIYSLMLANVMSPVIWRWREDPWFDGLARMKPYRRITRLKQYIMDHYIFNLDLDTWGLTTKERELGRFRDFIDEETLSKSNALFGYEGDKYYFDIDIRRHFGLDSYSGSVIPYWKTETVEAMDAFRYRPNYDTGAGECVSLSTLYAAALFIIGGIPLQDIYMMATPLHSQNYIDLDGGILTNNRRLVTKNMWFNGTALSAQARRALENERVTLLAHTTGCIHTVYQEATIDEKSYRHFSQRIRDFLRTPLTTELLGNFLRQHREFQKCFQVRFGRHGLDHYAAMERLFAYEHGSPYQITDNTRDKLIEEVESEELMHAPLPERIVFNDVEEFVKSRQLDVRKQEDIEALKTQFCHDCLDANAVIDKLIQFCHVDPRLPDSDAKRFSTSATPLGLDLDMSRQEIIERLESIRAKNLMADLAFHAYRDLSRTEPGPFLKAALERNPVSVEATREMKSEEIAARLDTMENSSIYEGPGRLAQPDEVWNYNRGDGLEKAILLANILKSREAGREMTIEITPTEAVVKTNSGDYRFMTGKGLSARTWKM